MTDADPTPLEALLVDLFAHDAGPGALERPVRGLGPFLHTTIDWDGPPAEVAARVAATVTPALFRQDGAHEAFFGLLLQDRPGRADAIAAAYEALFERRMAFGRPGAHLDTRHPAMSDDLVAGLGHCAGHCTATGWAELATTTVFQVYRFRQPWVVAALPAGALREIEPDYAGQTAPVFRAGLLPSTCVGRSLAGLLASAPAGTLVTFHDLFFDLARFGAGRSVGRLRKHGVDQAALRHFTDILGFGRITRHGVLAESGGG